MVMMAVFDREIKDKRVAGENRVLYLRATASLDAGSRFNGLPEKVSFTPKAFLDAFEQGVKNSATMKPMTDDDMTAKQAEEEKQQEKMAEIARRKEAEKQRAEMLDEIQDKIGSVSQDIQSKVVAILRASGCKKLSDPEFPIDALKNVYSLVA